MGGWGPLIAGGVLAATLLGARAADIDSVTACRFETIGSGRVAKIIDARSFRLDDGREVRLAAIEVPRPSEAPDAPGLAAKAALAAMLTDESVELRQDGPTTDRYGRIVAHAIFVRAGTEHSAAAELLAQGFARVAANVGAAACAAALLSQERAGRAAKLGLWADPYYQVLSAGNGAALSAVRGHFTVAEGKVLSVRKRGGTVYVNFGRRWSQALTVTILKRHERIFADAGLAPGTLEQHNVRVRGWVEERNGPRIEATRPEQIEFAEPGRTK
jgi:endonuclease YncB( thermonuclease family)